MYFQTALHNGSPEFMLAVLALLVALVMSQTVRGSGIAQHPYTKPHDGGELASDLPPESIGRPEFEPLLVAHPAAGVPSAPRVVPPAPRAHSATSADGARKAASRAASG